MTLERTLIFESKTLTEFYGKLLTLQKILEGIIH
jgi:hypothetical protein